MSTRAFACALALIAGASQAAPIIRTEIEQLGYGPANQDYRYIFTVSGVQFIANDELDIRFTADRFASLFNALPVDGFDIMLFAPNNPPGSPGDLSALALLDIGDGTQKFAVDVRYIGTGLPPISLPFVINRYPGGPSGGEPIPSDSGITLPLAAVPEPAPVAMTGLALAVGALSLVAVSSRRRAIRFCSSSR